MSQDAPKKTDQDELLVHILERLEGVEERTEDIEETLTHPADEGVLFSSLEEEDDDMQVLEANMDLYALLAKNHDIPVMFQSSEQGVMAIYLGDSDDAIDHLYGLALEERLANRLHTSKILAPANPSPSQGLAMVEAGMLAGVETYYHIDDETKQVYIRFFGVASNVHQAIYNSVAIVNSEVACA